MYPTGDILLHLFVSTESRVLSMLVGQGEFTSHNSSAKDQSRSEGLQSDNAKRMFKKQLRVQDGIRFIYLFREALNFSNFGR